MAALSRANLERMEVEAHREIYRVRTKGSEFIKFARTYRVPILQADATVDTTLAAGEIMPGIATTAVTDPRVVGIRGRKQATGGMEEITVEFMKPIAGTWLSPP